MSGRGDYVPKGGMCMQCEHRHEDCSDIDFRSMRPLAETEDGTVIVRCDFFERDPVTNNPLRYA